MIFVVFVNVFLGDVVVFFCGCGMLIFFNSVLNFFLFLVWFRFFSEVLSILILCLVNLFVKLIVVCFLNCIMIFLGFFKLMIFIIFFLVKGLKYNLLEIEKFVEIVFGLLFIIIVLYFVFWIV